MTYFRRPRGQGISTTLTRLEAEVAQLTQARAADTALLREVEWSGHRVVVATHRGHMHYGTCCICSRDESQGHATDCRLKARLEGTRWLRSVAPEHSLTSFFSIKSSHSRTTTRKPR